MPPPDDDHTRDTKIRRLREDVDDAKRRLDVLENERHDVFENIKRHVERALTAALRSVEESIEEIRKDTKVAIEQNSQQLAQSERMTMMLKEAKEAAEVRGMLRMRTELEEGQRKDLALRTDAKKVEVTESTASLDARVRNRTALLILIGTLATVLAGLIGAAIGSHH